MSCRFPHTVLFTDLDGTLLDARTYCPGPARPALSRVLQAGWAVVPCSSKTAAEQRPLREELGLLDFPCILENGSGLLGPGAVPRWEHVFGLPAPEVRHRIRLVGARLGIALTGFADIGREGVVSATGLSPAAADRALARDFSETLIDVLDPLAWRDVAREMASEGLRVSHGGRFHTVTSAEVDKGRAVRAAVAYFAAAADRRPRTIGIGDGENDASMLAAVESAYLVQRPDGRWADVEIPDLCRIPAAGPAGWVLAVEAAMAS